MSTDSGKTIKKEDVITAIRAVGQNPSQRECSNALAEIRLSSSSTVSFEEFQLIAQRVWKEEPMEELLNQAFKKFDKNGDGTVDTKEFKEIMLNYGEILNQKEFEDLMRLADLNHDGKISYSGC